MIIVLVVIVVAVIYILPTIFPTLWPYKKINLGLDLQGGMHLVLEVDTAKVVEDNLERIAQEFKSLLRKKRVRQAGIELVDGTQISIKIRGQENIKEFESLLNDEFKELRILSKSTVDGVLSIAMDLPDRETDYIKKLAVEQALETIRNRIDQFGVSEPDIRNQGEKRILIQLPGIKDTERAKELIGKTALLEFKLLDEIHDVNAAHFTNRLFTANYVIFIGMLVIVVLAENPCHFIFPTLIKTADSQ